MLAPVLVALALAAAPDVLTVPRPAEPEWFGIYVMGKKAGWSRTAFARARRDGRDVLVATAETTIRATVGGSEVARSTFDEKVYEARPGGRLLAFTARREGDGGARTITGRCEPSGCTVVVEGEGAREERRIGPARETADDSDASRLAAFRRERRRGAVLEPDRLRVKDLETRFVRRDRVAAAGVEIPISVVEERDADARAATVAQVADDGRVLEMKVGEAVVAKAEPEAVAKRLDRVDLFGLTRVALPGRLPRDVPGAIRFRFRGLPAAFAQDDPRQQVQPAAGGDTVVVVRATPPRAAAKDPPRGARPADETLLAATPEVDHDDPRIRKLAAEIVGGERGVFAAARRINDAVFRRLAKVYGSSRDRASEVLAAGKGDCTEHTLLFVALARAAGIPARQVHGLVYARYQDGVNALYWHAWPEVLAGDEWIALDPTFGQPVADATHVALGRGPQVDTVGLLGALKVVDAGPVALRQAAGG